MRIRSLNSGERSRHGGTLVIVGGEGGGKWVGKAGRMVQAPMMSPFISQTLTMLAVKHNGADLVVLKDLIEAGQGELPSSAGPTS